MAEIITVGDRYRIRRVDDRNLIVEEFRRPTKNSDDANSEKWYAAANGNPSHGPFFQSLGAALTWIFNRAVIDDPSERETLKDAIERIDGIAAELMRVEAVIEGSQNGAHSAVRDNDR